MFMDFGSLHQKRRTTAQQESFDRGLSNVTLWYGHSESLVFAMTSNPVGVIPYRERGWPTFEWSIASLLHSSGMMFDLGKFSDLCDSWLSTANICVATRTPPTAPDEFAKILSSKKFTNGRTDCDFVTEKYKAAFGDVISSVRTLVFEGIGWDVEQMVVLAGSLAFAHQLQSLNLSRNRIGAQGASALATGLARCSALQDRLIL